MYVHDLSNRLKNVFLKIYNRSSTYIQLHTPTIFNNIKVTKSQLLSLTILVVDNKPNQKYIYIYIPNNKKMYYIICTVFLSINLGYLPTFIRVEIISKKQIVCVHYIGRYTRSNLNISLKVLKIFRVPKLSR